MLRARQGAHAPVSENSYEELSYEFFRLQYSERGTEQNTFGDITVDLERNSHTNGENDRTTWKDTKSSSISLINLRILSFIAIYASKSAVDSATIQIPKL